MKFRIATKEFKNVMNLVKIVAEYSATARLTAHNVCLLRAFPESKQLNLEFSLNGSFLTYIFENVVFEGHHEGEFKRSVDLSSLASLKFSGSTIDITLGTSKEGNTLEFKSGILEGKLLLAHADIEKDVESNRPDPDSVELTNQFKISSFISALSAHNYGMHHNAHEASRRPVRIYNKKGSEDGAVPDQIFFVSKDKIAAASFTKVMTTPFKDEFNFYIHPKPLQAVLNTLSLESSPVFHFGISKDLWRLTHGNVEIYYPNIVPEVNFDLEELVAVVNTYPALSLKISPECIQKAISELAPFTSSTHLSIKEDMPIVRLTVEDEAAWFTLNTSKAKDVRVKLDSVEFNSSESTYDPNDALNLNFKFLSECVAALISVEDKDLDKDKDKDKDKKKKDKEPIYLKWWSYRDTMAPTKGKTLCLVRGDNYYWISRVRDIQRQV